MKRREFLLRSSALVVGGALLPACQHQDDDEPALLVTSPSDPALAGPQYRSQTLDDFSWLLQGSASFRYYSRLAGDRGEMGDGLHTHFVIDEAGGGAVRLRADSGPQGTSWHGIWWSLAGTATELTRTLDLDAILPSPILPAYQAAIRAYQITLRGSGNFKIEVKSAGNIRLAQWDLQVSSTSDVTINRNIPSGLGAVKFFNLVLESPGEIVVDRVTFTTEIPSLSPLRRAALFSLGKLLRCHDAATGRVRDRANWPLGDFDSTPASGFVAFAAACAADLSFLSAPAAAGMASQAIAAFLAAPEHAPSHWKCHWSTAGLISPNTEYSTVDTTLGALSALQAAQALGLTSELTAVRAYVDSLNYAVVTNGSNQLSHGLDQAGAMIPYAWTEFGGETSAAHLLRFYQNPAAAALSATHTPPVYAGRGFIAEMAALWASQFGSPGSPVDAWGVHWYTMRVQMFADQLAFRLGDSYYGASAAEIIDLIGETIYVNAGVGTPSDAAVDTVAGYSGPWTMPHYAGMAASLNIPAAEAFIAQLEADGLLQALIGFPDSILLGSGGSSVSRYHSVQIALNAFFEFAGLYHAICLQEGRTDVIYATATTDTRLQSALAILFP